MKKTIDGWLKEMNTFYQKLNNEIREIQNSPTFNERMEKLVEELIKIKE